MEVALTRAQVRLVDQIATERYGILGLVLMENAGRNAAAIVLDAIEATPREYGPVERVVVLCGTGNNGGDGFVIARHLVNAGVDVLIGLTGGKDRLSPDAAANARICEVMEIPMVEAGAVAILSTDLVVDALLGTGFTGQVRAPLAELIESVNAAGKAAVYAIDVPSGLDCDTGAASNATIVADVTITFVADKVGFHQSGADRFLGRVRIVGIGVPDAIIQQVLAE